MNCVTYSLFQFSYLHTFYKPNNIKTKPNTKIKTYFQIQLDKKTDKYSSLDPLGGIKAKERMEKLLLGVIPLL